MKKFFILPAAFILLAFFSLHKWDFAQNHPHPNKSTKSTHRILVTHKNGLGEKEMAKRIKIAAENLNISCHELSISSTFFLKRVVTSFRYLLIKHYNPTIIIALQGGLVHYPKALEFAALTHGSDFYFSHQSTFPIEDLLNYDGLLIAFPDTEKLINYYSFRQKKCPSMKWFTTCNATLFSPPSHFSLFYCGSNMAATSLGAKYKSLFSMLNRTKYFRVFGNKDEWNHMPSSYRGFIKNDGKELLHIMNKKGVTLILHGPDHLYGKTPTARIFEAAAASTVIICDKNPFIIQEFGDSVLYIDQNGSSDEIFQEIDAHMKWIETHKKEALLKAKKAHEIFITKFTLEAQLQNLIRLTEEM